MKLQTVTWADSSEFALDSTSNQEYTKYLLSTTYLQHTLAKL